MFLLQGALRDAIAAFACVSSVMMQKVYGLLQEYDLPISITPFPTDRCGHHSPKQVQFCHIVLMAFDYFHHYFLFEVECCSYQGLCSSTKLCQLIGEI